MSSCCRCQFKFNWVKSDLIAACDFQWCPSELRLLLVTSCSRSQEPDPPVLVPNEKSELRYPKTGSDGCRHSLQHCFCASPNCWVRVGTRVCCLPFFLLGDLRGCPSQVGLSWSISGICSPAVHCSQKRPFHQCPKKVTGCKELLMLPCCRSRRPQALSAHISLKCGREAFSFVAGVSQLPGQIRADSSYPTLAEGGGCWGVVGRTPCPGISCARRVCASPKPTQTAFPSSGGCRSAPPNPVLRLGGQD